MAFLSKKQVKQLISLSYASIDRMEKAGTFPKRMKLGQLRVAWESSEVEEWMQQRLAERNPD